ncbi:hypothetical protein [Crocinitomix catalasitica]|uniref:hypothetical protein n=1 Tax=Crocinitomix catalasitica TaxID=184607 RepID=UPI000483208E|nr:hypothetical protein [Crocinitomix catalasitica]
MKNIFLFIGLSFLVACSNSTDQKDGVERDEEKTEFPFKVEVLGAYVSTPYIQALQEHGSTKKAQEVAEMSSAVLYKAGNKIMFANTWNFHEGGPIAEITMIAPDRGMIVEDGNDTPIFEIDLSIPNKITLSNADDQYELSRINSNDQSDDYSHTINANILRGEFFLEDTEIQFLANGTIIGLDSITGYEFLTDYFDAGLDVDMITLKFADNRPQESFGYAIDKGTFMLFNLKCLQYDDTNEYCVERAFGERYLAFRRGKLEV